MWNATRRGSRLMAGLVAVSLIGPLCGCAPSSNQPAGAVPPSQAPYGSVPPPQQQQRAGLSTGKKVAILAGTAALIYLYNRHKNAQGQGAQGRYYRSRNGRIYYRDAQGNAIWVTPPSQGIEVPADQAQVYQQAARQGDWDVATR